MKLPNQAHPNCLELTEKFPGVADGSVSLARRERVHVQHCRTCQLELGNYRRLLGSMQALRGQVFEPPAGLLGAVLANVTERGEQHSVRAILSGRRVAYASGIAVAAAAGVTGYVLLGRSKGINRKAA